MVTGLEDEARIRSSLEHRKTGLEKWEIVIFGCTPYAKSIQTILSHWMIQAAAIIDNHPDKAGKDCMGIRVYQPEEYLLPVRDHVLVVICSKYHYEMKQQILHMGYGERNILDIIVQESMGCSGNSQKEFDERFKEIEQGYFIYQEIKKPYADDSKIFLCPYPGTGDVYMACSFLREYIERERIAHYILVVNGKACWKVAELFGINPVHVVSEEEKDLLLKAWEFLGSQKMQMKPLLHWGWRTKRYLFSDHHPEITFTQMFQYDVFGLDAGARPQHFSIGIDEGFCAQWFAKRNLKRGRTVILAPYAGSFQSNIPLGDWEGFVQALQAKGYDVCTNCYGEKEKPIKNTIPVQFSYQEGISLLEYAGGFVAVRSGLCDILSQANCRMVILYESGFNASSYEYFSLKKMGLNKKAIEFIYDQSTINKMINVFE